MTLTTHPHLVPRSGMSSSYIPLPSSASWRCSGTALAFSFSTTNVANSSVGKNYEMRKSPLLTWGSPFVCNITLRLAAVGVSRYLSFVWRSDEVGDSMGSGMRSIRAVFWKLKRDKGMVQYIELRSPDRRKNESVMASGLVWRDEIIWPRERGFIFHLRVFIKQQLILLKNKQKKKKRNVLLFVNCFRNRSLFGPDFIGDIYILDLITFRVKVLFFRWSYSLAL
jgi:hypothetical protein